MSVVNVLCAITLVNVKLANVYIVAVVLPKIVPTGMFMVLTLTLPLFAKLRDSVELLSVLMLLTFKLPVVIVATMFSDIVPSVKNCKPLPGVSVPILKLPASTYK